MDINYDVITSNIVKIVTMFFKTVIKDPRKVKRI